VIPIRTLTRTNFREEYYERIAYANEHYASGIPGWKTDRGRIYITWGKPDEVETHPSGGSYNRRVLRGRRINLKRIPSNDGSIVICPVSVSGVEIELSIRRAAANTAFARNPDEKDALPGHVPGAGLTLAEEMGLSNKGDRIANIGGIGSPNYQREQTVRFRACSSWPI